MNQRDHENLDPLDREIERTLSPGTFVAPSECGSFVTTLESVEIKIARLIATEPARATELYETFLAACYEKAEEVDDSTDDFGQFVRELFCGWTNARQASGADPDETSRRLIHWMEYDEYGFCTHLDRNLAKQVDRAALAAFERNVRRGLDAAATEDSATNGARHERPEYIRRRWGDVLRTIYIAQDDLTAYRGLAEEIGVTAQDCHVIATMLASRSRSDEALAWVERGIEVVDRDPRGSYVGYGLTRLRRTLLAALGRGDEALEAAWADFRERPATYTYDELMKFVPEAERLAWHDRAIEAASVADLRSLMELLVETEEIERLDELVRRTGDEALEAISHYATEPAAEALEQSQPLAAARLWRAQGLRIVNAGKSKYYDAALRNFDRAMRCYERAGRTTDWAETVSQVRAAHRRKIGFISSFERVVAGTGPREKPSFLDRARARWGRPGGREA